MMQGTDDDDKAKASKEAKKWADKMAERGFSNALGSGLGGVFADRIERLALISLTDISSIFCLQTGSSPMAEQRPIRSKRSQNRIEELTNAARRYLLSLALLAEGHPRSIWQLSLPFWV